MAVDAYKFVPSGHGAPTQRKSYAEPPRELRDEYEKWLDEIIVIEEPLNFRQEKELYDAALEIAKKLNPSVEEAHSLLVSYQGREKGYWGGLFVSAVYNTVPERDIVFDLVLDNPPNSLGYELGYGKRLVNLGNVESNLGDYAAGIVVNYGTTGGAAHQSSGFVLNYGNTKNLAIGASGLVINMGKALFMCDAATGIAINYGDISSDFFGFDRAKGIAIFPHEQRSLGDISKALVFNESRLKQNPDLNNYINDLRRSLEECRDDYRKLFSFLDGLGPNPEKTIEMHLKRLLRRKEI